MFMTTPWELLEAHCKGKDQLVIVAPYVKEEALGRLLDLVPASASITCVTRWNPNDIVVGASDVICYRIVTERGGTFRLHSSLHAKYYR